MILKCWSCDGYSKGNFFIEYSASSSVQSKIKEACHIVREQPLIGRFNTAACLTLSVQSSSQLLLLFVFLTVFQSRGGKSPGRQLEISLYWQIMICGQSLTHILAWEMCAQSDGFLTRVFKCTETGNGSICRYRLLLFSTRRMMRQERCSLFGASVWDLNWLPW